MLDLGADDAFSAAETAADEVGRSVSSSATTRTLVFRIDPYQGAAASLLNSVKMRVSVLSEERGSRLAITASFTGLVRGKHLCQQAIDRFITAM
jgi:hypothetical protein